MEMCMKPLMSLLITYLVLFVAGWVAETAPSPTADQAAVVEGNNAFAIELYGQLRNQSGNLFFSFGTPETKYTDARLCVTGKITSYRGRPEIIATDDFSAAKTLCNPSSQLSQESRGGCSKF
jgi:serine protease inhibitor